MSLTVHPAGDYYYLPGIAPYSCGVVSCPGFEIVHVTLQRPIPWRTGFELVSHFLADAGRARTALCSISLRSPRPFSFAGFAEFNGQYTAVLKDWGIFADGVNPIARTNIAPVQDPPAEPSLYGFAFTRPVKSAQPPTFVVAGAGELPEGILQRDAIVSLGDTSPAGLVSKAAYVMDLMANRLKGLGADWADVTTANIYTPHSVSPLLPEVILGRLSAARMHGAVWHYSRPPIDEIEFEMDMRGTRNEMRL